MIYNLKSLEDLSASWFFRIFKARNIIVCHILQIFNSVKAIFCGVICPGAKDVGMITAAVNKGQEFYFGLNWFGFGACYSYSKKLEIEGMEMMMWNQ